MADQVDKHLFREMYGRKATPIGGDNLEFSKNRRAARIAVQNGTATPEQRALIEDTDSVLREALGVEEPNG